MRFGGSSLLRVGLGIFGLGVGLNYLGGESFQTAALVIQLVGAALLVANAARSRREMTRDRGGEEED